MKAGNSEGAKIMQEKMEMTEECANAKQNKQNSKDNHFNGTVVHLTNSAQGRKCHTKNKHK